MVSKNELYIEIIKQAMKELSIGESALNDVSIEHVELQKNSQMTS